MADINITTLNTGSVPNITFGFTETVDAVALGAANTATAQAALALQAKNEAVLASESAQSNATFTDDRASAAAGSATEAQQAASQAGESAQQADASAQAAAQSVTDIEAITAGAVAVATVAAELSASQAGSSASEAATSAASALASKDASALSASEALASKNAAAQSASDALASKNAAASSATAADASKTAAAGSAAAAQTSATNASNTLASTVKGPASSVDGHIAVFDGTTGKQVKQGSVTIRNPNPEYATLGPELVSNGTFADASNWTLGAGWTVEGGKATVDLSVGGDLSQTLTGLVSGTGYYVTWTQDHSVLNNGTLTPAIGSVAGKALAIRGATESAMAQVVVANASGSLVLKFTPSAGSGTVSVSNLSVKAIEANQPHLTLQNSAGARRLEIRQSNVFNTAIGIDAQRSITTGNNNAAIGHYAQRSLTTGSSNAAIGYYAQQSLTTGYSNAAIGYYAQQSLTTGYSNAAIGVNAQQNLTTGYNNAAIGVNAARYTSGTTPWMLGNNCTHLGMGSRASGDGISYENVIGSDAQGNGSFTTTIGHTNQTDCYIRGRVRATGAVFPQAFALASVPSAASNTNGLIIVTNATGGPALCISNGTNWINIRTNTTVN